MTEENKSILLTSKDIKKLGHRVSAVTDILQMVNKDINTVEKDIFNLLTNELDNLATILMSIDDEEVLKELKA